MTGIVVAVAARRGHHFSKTPQLAIGMIAGEGVEGDGHRGTTVKHRSRWLKDRPAPNLRQVHLLDAEWLETLATRGFELAPGELGENVTTRGIDLLALSTGARLALGGAAVIEITGLRNPCRQIEDFRTGLLAQMLEKGADGAIIRRSGIMAVVVTGGLVQPGDAIAVTPPDGPLIPLQPV